MTGASGKKNQQTIVQLAGTTNLPSNKAILTNCLRGAPRIKLTENEANDIIVQADFTVMAHKIFEAITRELFNEKKLWPWYFFGATGRGKTSAAACIYRCWPNQPTWWSTETVLKHMVEKIYAEKAILRAVVEAGLLILDDIATREYTEYQLMALKKILDARANRPMIITGNHSPDALRSVLRDDRCMSRVCCGTLFHFEGVDMRLDAAKWAL